MPFQSSRKWQNYQSKIPRATLARTVAWFVAGVATALFAVTAMSAQNNAPTPPDPLGRTSPQDAIMQFLEACHARQYAKAAHYLDVRQLPKGDRDKGMPDLAKQLEDLLDDTPFDIATLSRSPEGDTEDGLRATREHVTTGQLLSVEAKSRHRQGVLAMPGTPEEKPQLRLMPLINDAVAKKPKHSLIICCGYQSTIQVGGESADTASRQYYIAPHSNFVG